ncbi:MAG TPA: hypothetical protein PLN69_00835 [bacterium]|nr:hypothetical protein [bacterium]
MRKVSSLLVLIIAVSAIGFFTEPAVAQEFSKEIDVLGFKFKVEDGSIEVENDMLVLKGRGSLDMSSALGEGAVITVEEMSIDHETTMKLKGITAPEINLGPVKAQIAPDDIVLEKIAEQGIDPYINLNVILDFDIAGEKAQVKTTIPITKDGLKDATVALNPAEGEESFLSMELDGLTLSLDSGVLEIKNKAFESFSFDGSINIMGSDFDLSGVTVSTDKTISGTIAPGEGASMQMGNIGLGIDGGINFEITPEGYQVDVDEISIDLAAMIPGAEGSIIINAMAISNGSFAAEGELLQKIDILGVELFVNHFSLNAEQTEPGNVFARLVLDGSISVPELDLKLDFTGMEIDSDGNVKGDVAIPEAQEFTMFGVGFQVDGITIDSTPEKFSVLARGQFFLGSQDKISFEGLTIAEGKVDCKFDISKENPFAFSWFQYLKVNQLEIDQSILVLGGQIDIPSPFEYTFEFEDIQFDPVGTVKAASQLTGEDVKAAASAAGGAAKDAAKKAWEELSNPDLIAIENVNEDPLEVAGFNFYIDAITVPNPLKVAKTGTTPNTLLSLYMRAELPIGDKVINVNIDGLEVTKQGIKDLRLELTPPEGQDKLLELSFFGWADLSIDYALLVIKDKKFESFGFVGSATIDGKGFNILDFSSRDGELVGMLRPTGDPYIELAGLKLQFGGEISFKVTKERAPPGGEQQGQAAQGGSTSFEVSFKKLSIDFSRIVGTSMSLMIDEFTISNGSIYAELSLQNTIDLFGLQMELSKMVFTSELPGQGESRVFNAVFNGAFRITNPFIELTFTNFLISSSGEFGGDLSLSALQEVEMFGLIVTIEKVNIHKKPAEPLVVTLDSMLSFEGHSLGIIVTYSNGLIKAAADISEENPMSLPFCEAIKITQLEIGNAGLALSGYLQLPDPIGLRLDLTELSINSRGQLSGGKLELHESAEINLGLFVVVIDSASFDLMTRYFQFSGEIRLPSDAIDQAFKFDNMGMSLANVGGGSLDTARSEIKTTNVKDNKHGIGLTLSNVGLGQKDGLFFVSMSGSLELGVGGYGFKLNFDNFKITQDIKFSIGTVTGGIKIAGFGLEISEFSFGDEGGDEFVLISGGISLPQLGGVNVTGLKVYKSGKVQLAGVRILVDYKAYVIDVQMSYIDEVFSLDGTVKLAGKGLRVAGSIGPESWSIYVQAYGLTVPLFPGVFLDSIGGGISYTKNPEVLSFTLSAGIAFGDRNLLYGEVSVTVYTTGLIIIDGELTALTMFTLASVHVEIDVPNATLVGIAKINAPIGGILLWIDAQIEIYASPTDFYVRGAATAKILNFFEVGYASFYIGTQGFEFTCGMHLDLGFVDAGFDFGVKIDRSFVFTGYFVGWIEFDIWICSVEGRIEARLRLDPNDFSTSYFYGSIYLKACVLKICGSVSVYLTIDKNGVHAGKKEEGE